MLLTIYLQFKSAVWFPKRAKSRRAGIRLQEDCQEDCIESRVSATGCPIPGKPYCPPREIFWAPAAPAGIHAGAHAKIPVAAPYRNAAQPSAAKTPAGTPARHGTRPPEYTPVRTQKSCRRVLSERCTTHAPQKRRPSRVPETPAETPARNTARRTCSGIVYPAPKHSAGLQSRITHKTSPSYIKKKRTARCGPIARF